MINIEKRDKIDIVSFSVNRINALITDEIRDTISNLFNNSNSRVIIDLAGVHYIDSTGFGCFIAIMKASKSSYSVLKFTRPEPVIMELFRTLQLHSVFEIYEDLDSCVRSFR
jgi:anti-sigma B factor antagonist